MDKVNYLEMCRIYKGEEKCPYELMDVRKSYWEGERLFVEQMEESPEGVKGYIAKYDVYPRVKFWRSDDDGVDGVLTGFLFAYYDMFAGDYHTMDEILTAFEKWYEGYKRL